MSSANFRYDRMHVLQIHAVICSQMVRSHCWCKLHVQCSSIALMYMHCKHLLRPHAQAAPTYLWMLVVLKKYVSGMLTVLLNSCRSLGS
jgi:hypothetical protein